MSNIIDKIRISGVTYTLQGSGGGGGIDSGTVQTMIDESISGKADSSAVTQEITAAVSGKVDTSSVVSSVTSASTDSQIPTAKAVYDAIPTVTNTITSGSTDAISSGAVYDALGDIETLLSQI